ncbi:hypothetical protein HPP92_026866 [Vanilla planifolia]|uniref:PB1 domain-containing protein n=1 Tax=Vanilla planifolia TaxID=51239 RepID=A0A835PDN1_VANPL|nr:hypothetical protein HPP92_026866 [Vanilla planifolia]KAG0484887.1 hypothetical protein HPP92_008966 [Vanilla planifolia]
MEGCPYPPYTDSGNSSPRFREIEVENAVSWDETPPLVPIRVKLMCSYGGQIKPRPHDNQLSYVGGETKILVVDRNLRFQLFLIKVATLYGANSPEDICFKYQLPGEDLDSLISVTNDEDLEHMMIEYDRLHRSTAKHTARLRLFLFPVKPAMGSASVLAPIELKNDRQWFMEGLDAVPMHLVPAQYQSNPLQPPPPPPPTTLVPDFLSGMMPPPAAVKPKDAAPEAVLVQPLTEDALPARSDTGKEDRQQKAGESAVSSSATEVPSQIQGINVLQLAETQQQQQQEQPALQRTGIDENLTRIYHGELNAPIVQEKLPPTTIQIPTTFWPDQRGISTANYTSMASGEQPIYLIPAPHGIYPPTAGQSYFTPVPPPISGATFPRILPAEMFGEIPAMYSVAHSQTAKFLGSQYPEGSTSSRTAVGVDAAPYASAHVAYDGGRRAVFYPSAVPAFQTLMTSVALNPEPQMANSSQLP